MHSPTPQNTDQTAIDLGLTKEEFELIKEKIGRIPNAIELRLFAEVWSDPIAEKNAYQWLKHLPTEGKHLIINGEEHHARIINIGDGLACVLNMASSDYDLDASMEEKASAASLQAHHLTLSQGAVPIGSILFGRFGDIKKESNAFKLKSTISGANAIHNTLGIPAINFDLVFNRVYEEKSLCQVLSLGIVPIGKSISPVSRKRDASIYILGKRMLGTQMKSPHSNAVDTLHQSLLSEAISEAISAGLIQHIKAVGLGGIVVASLSWIQNEENGVIIQMNKADQANFAIDPEELLLQGKNNTFLLVGYEGKEEAIKTLFERWQLEICPIGKFTNDGHFTIDKEGEIIAQVPVEAFKAIEGSPAYKKDYQKPSYLKKVNQFSYSKISKPKKWLQVAKKLIGSQNIVSRKWVEQQFDNTIGVNNLSANFCSDAKLLRLKDTDSILAVSTGGNSSYIFADPYTGGMMAVAKAARDIVCSGGKPRANILGLNFDHCDKPEIYWQFVNTIKGITDACIKLETPVANSMAHFFNKTPLNNLSSAIFPSPFVGMIGLIERPSHIMSASFKEEGHQIYMLGTPHNDFGSSEYLKVVHNIHMSPCPRFDLDEEYHTLQNLRKLIKRGFIQSAHNITEGGLFASLIECTLENNLGFSIETDHNFRKDTYLFGESQGRITISVTAENEDELVNYLNSHNVSFSKLGEVSGQRILVDDQDFGDVSEWTDLYNKWLYQKLDN